MTEDLPKGSTDSPTWDATALAALGVSTRRPCWEIEYRDQWATIGTLISTKEGVEVYPRRGLGESQDARLLATATQVWMCGRECLEGWRFRPGVGWVVDVGMRYSPSARRHASRSFKCSSAGGSPLVLVGSSPPSGV